MLKSYKSFKRNYIVVKTQDFETTNMKDKMNVGAIWKVER